VCPYSLDRKEHVFAAMEFSRCARARARPTRDTPPLPGIQGKSTPVIPTTEPVSQNSTACELADVEVDVLLGDPIDRTIVEIIDGSEAPRVSSPIEIESSSGFPRKEVIQPQLPLRLPCYDFTPIIDPTFDGSLPKGLGHRLRVLPTFVV
jgi:hypothetical protein